VYAATLANVHSRPKTMSDLRAMVEALRASKSVYVFSMDFEGEIAAGALGAAVGKRLWGLYAGSKKDADKLPGPGAGLALYWELMKWAKEQGFEDFDLQGYPMDSQPGDPLHGVYLFKRKWGGAEIRLIGEYDYAPYPLIRRLIESRLAGLKSSENAE